MHAFLATDLICAALGVLRTAYFVCLYKMYIVQANVEYTYNVYTVSAEPAQALYCILITILYTG